VVLIQGRATAEDGKMADRGTRGILPDAPNNAEFWAGFDGRTAMQLVQEGKAQQVLEYIDAVDAGVFA